MPRAFIKGLLSADLTTLFIPQEPKVIDPQAVDESLWITFDVFPGTHKFRSRQYIVGIGGGAGGVSVDAAATPVDNYDYVFLAAASHNDGAAGHRLGFHVRDVATGQRIPIFSSEDRLI